MINNRCQCQVYIIVIVFIVVAVTNCWARENLCDLRLHNISFQMKEESGNHNHEKLSKLANQALSRAEELKSDVATPGNSTTHQKQSDSSAVNIGRGLQNMNLKEENEVYDNESTKQLKAVGQDMYTPEEQMVLCQISVINKREYLPFIAADIKEQFVFSVPFTDKHGMLALSPKQQKNFSRWARPSEIIQDPKIIDKIDCFSIKQTIVSDCSFVASLAVCAQYERRFKKRIVTSVIFPKNHSGDPVYNSCGKYMVKLNINGIPRKVVIDDHLPLGKHGELLCSFSSNRKELWVSLLEKAYMKVMGGYDFPGSNSNIDLHSLTNWIPERVAIRPGDPEFDKDAVFRKLLERFHKGDVLVTLATGEFPEAEADRAGLVTSHAYAMLDVREVKGIRLLMLKNPWSHLRWRGRYSELDTLRWTDEMRKLLNYNPENAANFDNGVFWIDYESICKFFDVIYMNWNPQLFSFTYCLHSSWNAGVGPAKDQYNLGENPQYSLELNTNGSAAVWVLLSRHITDIADFRENKEYITLLVYNKTDGKKVYYPNDPAPFIDGVRINSPHYLCKILVNSAGSHKFTLVVSQYEKTKTIFYTLRAYSTVSFQMSKLTNPYKYKVEVVGAWKGQKAGGCGNHPTYIYNPKFSLVLGEVVSGHKLLVELKGPRKYAVGFEVTADSPGNGFGRKSSGAFRSGFCVLALDGVQPGNYTIIPSTFLPFQEGNFFLTVYSNGPCKLSPQ